LLHAFLCTGRAGWSETRGGVGATAGTCFESSPGSSRGIVTALAGPARPQVGVSSGTYRPLAQGRSGPAFRRNVRWSDSLRSMFRVALIAPGHRDVRWADPASGHCIEWHLSPLGTVGVQGRRSDVTCAGLTAAGRHIEWHITPLDTGTFRAGSGEPGRPCCLVDVF
jgi:hypothetical protein